MRDRLATRTGMDARHADSGSAAALEVAQRLRRATNATLEQAIKRFLDLSDRQGERHFVVEERLVLSALPDDDA